MTRLRRRNPDGSHRSSVLGIGMWVLGVGMLVGTAAGCTRARAEIVPEGPPLATPAPPPRILAPIEILAEAPPPPETPAESTPEPSAEREAVQPRPPVADTKPPEPQPAPAPPVAAETPVRTPTADPAEEKKIFEILQRAARDLGRVDYRNLKVDGKAQYEQSKRFSELAELAIKDRNYPLAATHADKAATIAEQLFRP